MSKKFKVGDKVRRINAGCSYSKFSTVKVGDTGVVTEVSPYSGWICIDTHPGCPDMNPDNFELVTEPKFKVGDKVRRFRGFGSDFQKDKTYTVTAVKEKSYATTIDLLEKPEKDYWWASEFELVESSENPYLPEEYKNRVVESELERLVRVANEGLVALTQIGRKYSRETNSLGLSYLADYNTSPVFIKPKPKFEPLTVGSNWRVELKGDVLHIGCKDFDARNFKNTLNDFCKADAKNRLVQGINAYAGRNNLMWSGYEITWSDADRILEALEKAGV